MSTLAGMPSRPGDSTTARIEAFGALRWTVAIVGGLALTAGGFVAVAVSDREGEPWLSPGAVGLYLAMLAAYAAVTWTVRGLRTPRRGPGERIQGALVETLIVGVGAAPALALLVVLVAFFAGGGPQ